MTRDEAPKKKKYSRDGENPDPWQVSALSVPFSPDYSKLFAKKESSAKEEKAAEERRLKDDAEALTAAEKEKAAEERRRKDDAKEEKAAEAERPQLRRRAPPEREGRDRKAGSSRQQAPRQSSRRG